MTQRYFGRPLAGDRPRDLRLVLMTVVATAGAVLVATAIDPDTVDALTSRAVAALLAAPVVTALLFGAHDGWKLLAQLRRAEAAVDVTPPAGAAPAQRTTLGDAARVALVSGALFTGISLVGGAAFCIAVGALIAGKALGSTLATLLVRRQERRLGRRYYRTTGEPEKVVWLGASGLE